MSTPAPSFSAPDDTHFGPARCQSCEATLATPIACAACHAIFPVPDETSHFTRLGIPERFTVDVDDAERRFIALSRELHPDFFTSRSPEEQALSLAHSAQLNDAIAVIRDPFARAAYLLQRWAPQAVEGRDQQMPDGFLEEMLMFREDIQEAAAEAPGPDREVELARLRSDLAARRDALQSELADAFVRVERAREAGEDFTPDATHIRRVLNAARYIMGSLNTVREVQA